MREITTHKVNGCNEAITITARDEPGHGGANHTYWLEFDNPKNSPCDHQVYLLQFQNGPIVEAGTNGITHEALLAVLIDRLEGFQSGPYQCAENADALEYCQKAMEALHRRTKARVERGVEGTHKV